MKSWNGGFITATSGGGGKAASGSEDFEEKEVWDTVKAGESLNTRSIDTVRGSSSSAWRLNAANPRSVLGAPADGGWRKVFAAAEWAELRQSSSVPADHTPEWLRKRSEKKMWGYDACDAHSDDDACDRDDDDDDHGKVDEIDDDDDGRGGGDGGMVPPHEYLARKLAKSQIASHSMCEGVGRTLKGRDLSKLRNAILTKTGFIESRMN